MTGCGQSLVMPLSTSRSLDPDAMRASWTKWFSFRSARLAPEVVNSYELPAIKEWYAASDSSSIGSPASLSEAGSPGKGAGALLMRCSINGSHPGPGSVHASVPDDGQLQQQASPQHPVTRPDQELGKQVGAGTQAPQEVHTPANAKSNEHQDAECCGSSACGAHCSPSLPLPDLSVCQLHSALSAGPAPAQHSTASPPDVCATNSGANICNPTAQLPGSTRSAIEPVEVGAACALHGAAAGTATPLDLLPRQHQEQQDEQLMCVSLVLEEGGSRVKLELVELKSSVHSAHILATQNTPSRAQPALCGSALAHSCSQHALRPSSARSAKILAALCNKAAGQSARPDNGPRDLPAATAALSGDLVACGAADDDQSLDVHHTTPDQRSGGARFLLAPGAGSCRKDQGPSTRVRKANRALIQLDTGSSGSLGLKDRSQHTVKHGPLPDSEDDDIRHCLLTPPSTNALAAQPQQQVVAACMVSAAYMTGPGTCAKGSDTCQKKDAECQRYKAANTPLTSLKQSDGMLKETWGSSDVDNDDVRPQQPQPQPSITKRRLQQQRQHDSREAHRGHTGPQQQQQLQQQQPVQGQEAPRKDTKAPLAQLLPAQQQPLQKPGEFQAKLPAKAPRLPPLVPPLRLDVMAAAPEDGSMPALTASDSPVVSQRAPRSSRTGIVSPFQKGAVEAPLEPQADETPEAAVAEGIKHAAAEPPAPQLLADHSARAAKRACRTMANIVSKIVPDFKGPSLGASVSDSSDGFGLVAALGPAKRPGWAPKDEMMEASIGTSLGDCPSVKQLQAQKQQQKVTQADPHGGRINKTQRRVRAEAAAAADVGAKKVAASASSSTQHAPSSTAAAPRLKPAASTKLDSAEGGVAPITAPSTAAPLPPPPRAASQCNLPSLPAVPAHTLCPLDLAQLPPPRLSPRMFADALQPQAPAAPSIDVGEGQFGSPVDAEEEIVAPWEMGPDSCKAQEGQAAGSGHELAVDDGVPCGEQAAAAAAAAAAIAGTGAGEQEVPAKAESGAGKQGEVPKEGAAALVVKECIAEWVGQEGEMADEEVHLEVVQAGSADDKAAATAKAVSVGEADAAVQVATQMEHTAPRTAPRAAAALTGVQGSNVAVRGLMQSGPQPRAKKASQGSGFCACFAPKVRE